MDKIYYNKIFLVIPEVKLFEGKCDFCIKGEPSTKEFYLKLSKNPAELCCLLRRENAKTILLTILDDELNDDYLKLILEITKSVDITIQVSANFKDLEQCEFLLDNDIFRIHINPIEKFDLNNLHDFVRKYKSPRINAQVFTDNFRLSSEKYYAIALENYLLQLKEIGFKRIVFSDKNVIENKKNYNLEKIKELSSDTGIDITLYHGATSPQNLWKMNEYLYNGIDSVILGAELYDNYFPCQKIWRLAEDKFENKINR